MQQALLAVLVLLFGVFLLVMIAQRIKIAYPIFLVVAGLGISMIPGVPNLHLDPELIFLIFLPPLLYEAAWYTSWNDFWKWRRPIGLLAFGLVFFTSTLVAYSSTAIIPGFTLALGFLLGGIISPPDAVAAASVMKGMHAPKRLMTILEGESLVNDASSLIVFRFAMAAVLTGSFSMEVAVGQFFWVAGMGIVIGLAGAHIIYAVHRFLPTTPAIDAALTVMTPYMLFLAAEHFHYSGVMAVVTGGLFMSWRQHEIFRTGSTRMNMLGVWTTLIFAMNTLVFVLIGLELPEIVNGLGEYSVGDGIRYGLIISLIVILIRFIWVFPAAHIPRFLSARIKRNEPSPGWKGPFVISWAGMRGVVSLATALSIPLLMKNGETFPHRNLIIFITFIVILITLVVQGLSLPFIMKLIKIREIDNVVPEEEQQAGIQMQLNTLALKLLHEKYHSMISENELIAVYEQQLKQENTNARLKLNSLECKAVQHKDITMYNQVLLDVYTQQKNEVFRLRKEKLFNDEELRKAELQIDLNELKITGIGH